MSRSLLLSLALAALLASCLASFLSGQEPAVSPELKQAAQDASLPALKALYEDLATPADEVMLRDRKQQPRQQPLRIRPLAAFNKGGTRDLKGQVRLDAIQPAERSEELTRTPAENITSHTSYEIRALARLDLFEKEQKALPGLELVMANERVLTAVLRFHESERVEGIRRAPEWAEIHKQLRARLLDVRLQHLDTRTRNRDWDQALALAQRLLDAYGPEREGEGPPPEKLAAGLLRVVDDLTSDVKLDATRRLALQESYSKALQPFKGRLVAARAIDRLMQLARDALRETTTANDLIRTDAARAQEHANRAQEYLTRAEKLWPDLPEIRSITLFTQRPDLILRIGVRELPRLFSPALASTDDERRIVEMLFESLVEPRYDRAGDLTYVPALAESLPVVIPQGRRFQIQRNASWSDGKPVLPVDVRSSLERLIANRHLDRAAPLAADVLEAAIVSGDDRRVDVRFKRGTLDALSPMSFKILPGHCVPTSPEFACEPIGSGPYMVVKGTRQEQGRETLILRANPQYSKRPGQSALPVIRVLQFVVSTDPLKDLQRGQIDLALDVPPAKQGTLEQRQAIKVQLAQHETGRLNRRVYFLAVNHSRDLLKNVEFRRALSHSLERSKLMKPLGITPLPGLYPPGTWAFSEKDHPKLDPFDPVLAREGLKKTVRGASELTLTIPAGDPEVKAAFDEWATDLSKLSDGNLTLKVLALPQRELHAAVERGDYHLAYMSYDHPDQTFWLGPLFASRGRVEEQNLFRFWDGEMDRWLLEAHRHREFGPMRERTRLVATRLATQMPVIPLWQRSPSHLIHESVKTVDLDPEWPFGAIERWTLDRPNRP